MRLISTTLASNNEDIIVDALRSVVSWVDVCLVIDTGIRDASLERARDIAGDKLAVRPFAWTGSFSDARNFALDAAAELGGTWAVTVDSDERLELRGLDVRRALADATEGVLYVSDEDGTYLKERFFRLPMPVRWRGPTHESFAAFEVGTRVLSQAIFRELPKSPEQRREKFQRDAEILTRYTQLHPEDPRWFYYLGESFRNLERYEEAVSAYDACVALRGWDEEGAWASFRAAECLSVLERFEDALFRCARGLGHHAGIAELAWLAGYVCYQLGRDAQAVYWSRLALVHGAVEGDARAIPRLGFRNLTGLWEGPYDVLRWAERRRGHAVAAAEAERRYEEALRLREAKGGRP